MTYKLEFLPQALKEWKALNKTEQTQLKKKLQERLTHPHVIKDQLRGGISLYKIKLRSAGIRLIYQAEKDMLTLLVIAIGKRENNDAYDIAFRRL